jgi:sensor histidine kinase YesM
MFVREAQKNAPMKRKWLFSLGWINLAVGLVILIQFASGQIGNSRDFLNTLLYSLVYSNLTGILGVLLMGGLVERMMLRRLPLFPAVLVCLIPFVAVGCLASQLLLMWIGVAAPKHFWTDYLHTLRVAMPLAIVFGLGALVHALLQERIQTIEKHLHEKEVAEERTRKLAAEARLRSLEARIQPHFLFNTLNSISSLIAVNPARAEQIVGRLATLLRASLDNSGQSLIPLRQELAMVQSYVDIERARLGEKLRGSVDVPEALLNANVPPMSVQSLVENAVKHGITPLSAGGEVRVAASTTNGSLRIEVEDSGHGFDLSVVPPGHGINNLVERLDALFGDRARLNAFRRNAGSVVEMVIPLV